MKNPRKEKPLKSAPASCQHQYFTAWTHFSQEEKVDKLFQNANERIAEIRELIEGSKASKAQKAAKLQAEAISQAASFMSIYDSGPVTEQFLFREGFIASLQLHAIEIAELADYYPEKITAKERLANDFLIDSLVKPVENLNKDLVNKGWEGITEKSTDEAISRAESLLAQTRGNSFFTKKHYDDMDSEMAQAKSENKKGNFVEAKSLANSLAVHIGEEMLISQIPESSG